MYAYVCLGFTANSYIFFNYRNTGWSVSELMKTQLLLTMTVSAYCSAFFLDKMYTANAAQTQISLFREQACDSCSDERTVTHPPPPNNSRNTVQYSQEHASPFPITLAHDLRLHRGVYPGVGDIDPWKYVWGVRVCCDPLKCHILSFKTVEWWSNDTTVTYTCGRLQSVSFRQSVPGEVIGSTAKRRSLSVGAALVPEFCSEIHCAVVFIVTVSIRVSRPMWE